MTEVDSCGFMYSSYTPFYIFYFFFHMMPGFLAWKKRAYLEVWKKEMTQYRQCLDTRLSGHYGSSIEEYTYVYLHMRNIGMPV